MCLQLLNMQFNNTFIEIDAKIGTVAMHNQSLVRTGQAQWVYLTSELSQCCQTVLALRACAVDMSRGLIVNDLCRN